MKKIFFLIIPLFLLISLSGCGSLFSSTPEVQATFTPIVLPTEILLPTAAPITEPTATSTPEPTSTPSQITMLEAQVVFDNYILRTGPGRLFDRIAMYDSGIAVTLVGREISNNWVLVITGDNYSGWMNVVGLDVLGDISSLPVFSVDNALALHGHVYTQGGDPAEGIVVTIVPSDHDLSEAYDTSSTTATGVWAIYMPADTEGDWIIGPNAFTCAESNAVTLNSDGSCTLIGNLPNPQSITLPQAAELELEFQILPPGGSD